MTLEGNNGESVWVEPSSSGNDDDNKNRGMITTDEEVVTRTHLYQSSFVDVESVDPIPRHCSSIIKTSFKKPMETHL